MNIRKGGTIKALILLGGQGTRLRPFTLTTPKSFLPVANVPLIYYQLMLLVQYKVDNVILAINSQCHIRREIFSTARDLGIKISVSCEKYPLGTAGAIRNANKFFKGNEPFFVFNGDIICDCDLGKMIEFHKDNGADVSIATTEIENPRNFGVIIVDEQKRIKQFIEKPQEPISNLINAGIYIMQPDVVEEIPSAREVSIEKEVFPNFIKNGKNLFAYVHTGYWKDVGTLQNYRVANFDMLEKKMKFDYGMEPEQVSRYFENVRVNGRLKIGKDVIFGENVVINGSVIIGDGCYVGENTVLNDTIVFNNILIGKNCCIRNSIIGNNVFIEDNCEIIDSAIADGCRLCQHTRLNKGV